MKKLLNLFFIVLFFSGFLACQSSQRTHANAYVLAVQADSLQQLYPDAEVLFPDTIVESNPVRIYGMAVQRYAAALFFIHEKEPKKTPALDGIQILSGAAGQEAALNLSQEQRDSVLMDFIKFARRSNIPYHETIKDFELKLMKIR